MSNLQTLRSVYEAFGRGDIPAILEVMSDEVDWERWEVDHTGQQAGVPWLEPRQGRDGAARQNTSRRRRALWPGWAE